MATSKTQQGIDEEPSEPSQPVLGLDLSFPMSMKSGSTTMIGYRDDRHFVLIQFYAVIGGSISRYKLSVALEENLSCDCPEEPVGGSWQP